MKFKCDLLIIDPLYLSKEKDWGESFNWNLYQIENPNFTKYLWCEEVKDCGLTINNDPGVVDGNNYFVFQPKKKITKENVLTEVINDFLENGDDDSLNEIGNYFIESGTVGVFDLSEAIKYNPTIFDELPKDCYCIIKDFDGRVEIKNEEDFDLESSIYINIIGIGNKTFFTSL